MKTPDRNKDVENLLGRTKPASPSRVARAHILSRSRELWDAPVRAGEAGFPWPMLAACALALILAFSAQSMPGVADETLHGREVTTQHLQTASPLAGYFRSRPRPLKAEVLQARLRTLQDLAEDPPPPPASSKALRPESLISTV